MAQFDTAPLAMPLAASAQAQVLPVRRTDLLLGAAGEDGSCVVKDRRTNEYFRLGPEEAFLLSRLDGRQNAEDVRQSFGQRFGEVLPPEDFEDFLAIARERRLVESNHGSESGAPQLTSGDVSRSRQSLLYWRVRLFDPDRLMTWLEPRLRFAWTQGFLIVSASSVVAALFLAYANGELIVSHFSEALRWQTVLLAWFVLVAVTTLHEFAHGLTCKHFGGEVHEIGFLLMFFIPCFYCNVSDAWLFREKSKRLWVTFAGGYLDLVLWSLAIFAWRLTPVGTLANHLAWVLLSVLGARVFFNFNPLLKLDGYYLLSDLCETPNLRERAIGRMQATARHLLWGAPRPCREKGGRAPFWLGLTMWIFSLGFLVLMLWGMGSWGADRIGPIVLVPIAALGLATVLPLLRGFGEGEVSAMFRSRLLRTGLWGGLLVAVPAALAPVEVVDRCGGELEIRPAARAEVRAPLAGFLREVRADEGDFVSPGEPVAVLEIPDLATRIAKAEAGVREAEARLRLLEAGTRPEEIAELQSRIARSRAWQDSARNGLQCAKQVEEEDLTRLAQVAAEHKAELERAEAELRRVEALHARKSTTESEYQRVKAAQLVALAQWEQAEAARRAREATGSHVAEEEAILRQTELAEAEAAFALADAGTRPEEIDAARAHATSLQEDLNYLRGLRSRLEVTSPIIGVATTPRLKERIGEYLREGDLICEIIDPSRLRAEVRVSEQDATRIRQGQKVGVKLRALAGETLWAQVDRIAPVAAVSEDAGPQHSISVWCELNNRGLRLRPAMTGYARIYGERRPLGDIALDRARRFLRTEFWW